MLTKTEQDLKALVECALDDGMTRHQIIKLVKEESFVLLPVGYLWEDAEHAMVVLLNQIMWEARSNAQQERATKARHVRDNFNQ